MYTFFWATLYFHLCKEGPAMYFTDSAGHMAVFFLIYFADRASQYIYLNINQLDALNFIMSLFHDSTCFEHKCSSSGGQNCTIQSLVSSHDTTWYQRLYSTQHMCCTCDCIVHNIYTQHVCQRIDAISITWGLHVSAVKQPSSWRCTYLGIWCCVTGLKWFTTFWRKNSVFILKHQTT